MKKVSNFIRSKNEKIKPIFFLNLDLLCSSEDEFDEVPFGEPNSEMDQIELTEMKPAEIPADDDSQQVAEAMVQLGNFGIYVEEQPIINQGKQNLYVSQP